MKKSILTLLILTAVSAVITLSSFRTEEKKYSEEEFFEIIASERMFTDEEARILIEQTDFETISPAMIRRCDGSADDYCKGNFPDGVPRPKCCIKAIAPNQ